MEKLRSRGSWQAIRDRFYETLDGESCLHEVSSLVEREVTILCEGAASPTAPPFAVLASGGFGRRELFPHSDIDLVFLHRSETESDALSQIVRPVTQALWDLGLEPSHSVRGLREVARFQADNTEFYLSLVDARPIFGDAALCRDFEAARRELLRDKSDRIAQRLFELIDGRWRGFQYTLHHLEPDLKDAPGGLRDLHSIRWLSTLKNETPFWANGKRWPEFERNAMEHFAAIRCFLHYEQKRNQNLLRFDPQEEWLELVARRGGDAGHWVREHYRMARDIQRELERWMERFQATTNALLAGIQSWRSRLSNSDFSVSRSKVYFKSPLRLETEPAHAWRAYEFVAKHGLDLGWDTIERLSRDPHAAVAATPDGSSQGHWILRILGAPHADVAVRAMERTGFLSALFPEWEDIDCLLVRDFYHRYTVDEHTLVCIDSLCELERGKKELDPRMLDLAEQTQTQALVVFALIFHDIGKKHGVEGHAERSRDLAAAAMARAGFDTADSETVQKLIENHLLLSIAMRTRDLSDPATGKEIADITETLPMLRMLTLMTYADVRAVFPGALTPWRMDQLWSTYRIAQVALEDRVARERVHPSEEEYSAEERRFLDGFSTRYLRIFLPAQIRDHYELHRSRSNGGSGLRLREAERAFELVAVGNDGAGLFAELTGVLSGMGQNILLADAFRNSHGVAVLRFQFEDPSRTLSLNPSDKERLLERLERVLQHGSKAAEVLPRRGPQRVPHAHRKVEPYVYARNDVAPTLTMVELSAPDRQGLLYQIANAVAAEGCDIDVLIIETRAHRAFDTLYVQKEGRELTAEEQSHLVRRLLSVLKG